MSMKSFLRYLLIAVALLLGSEAGPAEASTVLRNICRIKGQEENTLHGWGIVVGLNGTGEAADAPTMRMLSRALEIMGNPIPQAGIAGSNGIDELKKWKNMALVEVIAKVPATGAQRGDKLNCLVSGVNGKSLAGGRLMLTVLQGPSPMDQTVYALAQGQVHLEDPNQPMAGKIYDGCKMEEDVTTQYEQNGKITVVLDKNHANFSTATEIVDMVMQYYSLKDNQVRALNAANIEIMVPTQYRDEPVTFIADLLDKPIYSPAPESRVIINERTGSIVMDGEIEIGDVVVSHRNITVEAGATSSFTAFEIEKQNSARLRDLVDALDSLNISDEDAIEIIKQIHKTGKLHAKLVTD